MSCNVYSYGASIVAETQAVPPIFQRLLNNPLCFLLYEEKDVDPNEWSEVSNSIDIMYVCCYGNIFLLMYTNLYNAIVIGVDLL